MRFAWALAVAAAGCAGSGVPEIREPVGDSHLPYTALPGYLEGPPPQPLGPIGRYSERVPVASLRPELASISDQLRLRIADVEQAAVAMRGSPPPRSVGKLKRAVDDLAELVAGRPDLAAEAQEMAEATLQMAQAPPVQTDQLIDRVLAVLDLMRLQLRVAA